MIPKNAHKCIIEQSVTGSGTISEKFSVHNDSVMVSVFVRSISGTLDISVYCYGDKESERVEVISFPQLSATSTELLLRKSSLTLNKIIIEATHSDDCDFTILARGIDSADSTVSIAGAANAVASQKTVTTSAGPLVGSSLDDRKGLTIRNYSATTTIYIGYSVAETTAANGFPLDAKESIPIDLEAGVTVYALTGSGTADVRIMEAGS